jgi:signal recognition particle subunit SRP54
MPASSFNFEDMLGQFKAMRKMGNFQSLIRMIDGYSKTLSEEQLSRISDKNVDRIEAIILSMTPTERRDPDLINGSRRKRLASGSGTSVEDVNKLIKQLYETRRQMGGFGNG